MYLVNVRKSIETTLTGKVLAEAVLAVMSLLVTSPTGAPCDLVTSHVVTSHRGGRVLAEALFITVVNASLQRTHVSHVAAKPLRNLTTQRVHT